jgi:hypothetical protein
VLLEQIERAFKAVGSHLMAGDPSVNSANNFRIQPDNVTSELIVFPHKQKHTDLSPQLLSTFTKKRICELALENFGVTLEYNTLKKDLMQQYMDLQLSNYHEGYV